MGFPSVSYDLIQLPKPVLFFISFLQYIAFAISLILRRLGLCALLEPLIPPWEEQPANYFSATTDDVWSPPPSASAAAVAAASSIKQQLRVVEFSSLSKSRSTRTTTCVICLGEVEAENKVRELGNCGHGFHLECIDGWVDVGQVTCPLCRGHLLPPVEEEGGRELEKNSTISLN